MNSAKKTVRNCRPLPLAWNTRNIDSWRQLFALHPCVQIKTRTSQSIVGLDRIASLLHKCSRQTFFGWEVNTWLRVVQNGVVCTYKNHFQLKDALIGKIPRYGRTPTLSLPSLADNQRIPKPTLIKKNPKRVNQPSSHKSVTGNSTPFLKPPSRSPPLK